MTNAAPRPDEAALLARLAALYPADPRYALAALEEVQAHLGYLPASVLEPIARHFGCPLPRLQRWRASREAFRSRPPALHALRVCAGPLCRGRGGKAWLQALRERAASAGVDLEPSPCLGACHEPPVACLDGARFSGADADRLMAAVDALDGGGGRPAPARGAPGVARRAAPGA